MLGAMAQTSSLGSFPALQKRKLSLGRWNAWEWNRGLWLWCWAPCALKSQCTRIGLAGTVHLFQRCWKSLGSLEGSWPVCLWLREFLPRDLYSSSAEVLTISKHTWSDTAVSAHIPFPLVRISLFFIWKPPTHPFKLTFSVAAPQLPQAKFVISTSVLPKLSPSQPLNQASVSLRRQCLKYKEYICVLKSLSLSLSGI